MICSEKELGISDEHEGVIILDEDAPVGVPLVEYIGDAVLEINIIPNIARAANVLGVAREIAALTGQPLRLPVEDIRAEGPSIEGKAAIVIENAELNPRFVLGLIENVTIKPSPYWVQRRLRLAGMRPINNIVDATNYAMLELGEPLHAFDYDILIQRAGGKAPSIITRTALPGERLTTLDDVERKLDEFTELVTDTTGALSIAGVMGGAEFGSQRADAHRAAGRCGVEFYQRAEDHGRPKDEFRSRLPFLARRSPGDGAARRATRPAVNASMGRRAGLPGTGGQLSFAL